MINSHFFLIPLPHLEVVDHLLGHPVGVVRRGPLPLLLLEEPLELRQADLPVHGARGAGVEELGKLKGQ